MEDMSDILNEFSKMADSGDLSDTLSSLLKNSNSSKNSSNLGFENLDFNTILKAKSLFEKANTKDDPRTSLLLALKPYLKENKQDKIEQYIQLLNLSKIFEIFKEENNDDEL